jgi:hypothetical protein
MHPSSLSLLCRRFFAPAARQRPGVRQPSAAFGHGVLERRRVREHERHNHDAPKAAEGCRTPQPEGPLPAPSRSPQRLGVLLLLLAALAPAGAQTISLINVPAVDSGFYDVYGSRDARQTTGLTGLTVESRARGPYRSLMVFHIPQFEGVLISAAVSSAATYAISPDGVETLLLHGVATPVDTLRKGGFGLTNIYDDLADGPLYASQPFPSGFSYDTSIPLDAIGVDAISAARGQDFALGGAVAVLDSDEIYNEFIQFPFSAPSALTLQLKVSVPVAPRIHTQPPPLMLYSNDVFLSVGACGFEPLYFHWFVNGTNYGPSTSPGFYFPYLTTNPQPAFVIVSNLFGTVTSVVSQVRLVPAVFHLLFTNLTVRVGDNVDVFPDIHVLDWPSTIFMQKDGRTLTNESVWSLSLPKVQTNDTGNYTFIVSNQLGSITSAVVRLEVVETPPVFWEQPASVSSALGTSLYLSAYVQGGPPPGLSWYHHNAPLSGEVNAYLYLPVLSFSDTGGYYLVASNHLGMVTSRVAYVSTYLDPPVFTLEPEDTVAYPGDVLQFDVSVLGNPYPSFQWYFNQTLMLGAETSSYVVGGGQVSSNDTGVYFCVASNVSGVTTSALATLSVLYVPPVLSGPNDAVVPAGFEHRLSASLRNWSPEVAWQWQFNGVDLAGAVTPTLILPKIAPGQAGLYRVIVTNAFGVSTSRVATVTVVVTPPVFQQDLTNVTVLEGSAIDLFVIVAGAPSPVLTLYHDDLPSGLLPGSPNYFHIPAATPADAGNYYIVARNLGGVATSHVAQVTVLRTGPLDRWAPRNPAPQGENLRAIAWGGNRFVAVGNNGAIIHSLDGTNWNSRPYRTSANLQAVAYGNGLFVAAGEQGMVLASTNADTWTARQTSFDDTFRGVAYGNGRFFVVGPDTAYISTNGLDWAQVALPPSGSSFDAVTFGKGLFVLANDSGGIFSSGDLLAWAYQDTAVTDVEGAAYLNGRFFVTGNNGRFALSSDGLAWTTITNNVTTRRLYGAAYGAGRYILVGARGTIISATEPETWANVLSPTVDRLEDVIFANGLFVAVGENGVILTSNDGQSWVNQLRGSNADLDGLAVGNGLALAVGKNDTLLTSGNGRDWTRQAVPQVAGAVPADWHGAAYGNGKWVVVGQSTNVLTSTNAVDWEIHPYPAPGYLKSVLYANGLWVAVGVAGLIVTSPDGSNWTLQASGTPDDLNEVVYGNGEFVVVGDHRPFPNGTMLTSSNGLQWADASYGTSKNTRGIAFANDLFVVAVNDGGILYGPHPEARNWQYGFTGISNDGANLRGLTWSNGLWVCVGNSGLLLTATNPATWSRRLTPTTENLHAVRYLNGTFIAIGNRGTILQSAPLAPELFAGRSGSNLVLTFSSPFESVVRLQQTADFTWHDLALLTNLLGTVDYTLPLPQGPGARFYRVVSP